jgi:hypothetical protein
MAYSPVVSNHDVIGNVNVHKNNDSQIVYRGSSQAKARVYVEPGRKYP